MWLESTGWKEPSSKGPGVLTDRELNTGQQCAFGKEGQWPAGLRWNGCHSSSREVIPPLYSVLVKHTCSAGSHSKAPLYEGVMDILEQVQQKATKMMRGLDHLSYSERLRAAAV